MPRRRGRTITMKTIPEDVLRIIFILACPLVPADPEFDEFFLDGSVIDGAYESWYRKEENTCIAISHVCRNWRELALEIGELWTRITFRYPSFTQKSTAFLDRSKNAPLAVTFIGAIHPTLFQTFQYTSWSYPFLSRVKYVSFKHQQCDPDTLASLIQAIFVYCGENLVGLDLRTRGRMEPHLRISGGTPPLRSLAISGYTFDIPPPAIFCRNLTTLKLTRVWGPFSFEIFATMVVSSDSLETLYVHYASPSGPHDDWPTRRFLLGSLRRLSIESHSPEYVTALLKRFIFPKLRYLRVDLGDLEADSWDDGNAFLEHLMVPAGEGHGCPLDGVEVLVLGGLLKCNNGLIPRFYESAPKLRCLHLDLTLLRRAFLDVLSTHSLATQKLEILSIQNGTDITPVLHRRRVSGFPIKRVILNKFDRFFAENEEPYYCGVSDFPSLYHFDPFPTLSPFDIYLPSSTAFPFSS